MKDFIVGFEAEPEIRFSETHNGEPVDTVRMWEGYFDELMGLLVPGPDGWSGLALQYNLVTGWYVSPSWRVPDLQNTVAEWKSISTDDLDTEVRLAHSAVLDLLEHARRAGHSVSIECL